MKSLTSQSLTPDARNALAERLAEHWLDHMSTRDLERFFFDTQRENLMDSYSDSELIEEVEAVLCDDYKTLLDEDYE